MKKIHSKQIEKTVEKLFIDANLIMRPDIKQAIKSALSREKNQKAKLVLEILLKNAKIAKSKKIALCQDTGFPVVFCSIGNRIKIEGDIKKAIQRGIKKAYAGSKFRKSIVQDPILRGKADYLPGLIHFDFNNTNQIKIKVLAKGFGSENKTFLKMFKPTSTKKEIISFVTDIIRNIGQDACPPFIIGIGIGGTAEEAVFLSKKALIEKIGVKNRKKHLAFLSDAILKEINKIGIGPMGFGGKTTALGVNILDAPTHIAGLPVVLSVGCHSVRSRGAIL